MDTFALIQKNLNLVTSHLRRRSDYSGNKENHILAKIKSGISNLNNKPCIIVRSHSNKQQSLNLREKPAIEMNKIIPLCNKNVNTTRNLQCVGKKECRRKLSERILSTDRIANLNKGIVIGNKIIMKCAPQISGVNSNRFFKRLNDFEAKLEKFYKEKS